MMGGVGVGPTAALLVRVISAVVVIVTLPAAWDAAVVFAAELVWLTGALIWGKVRCGGRYWGSQGWSGQRILGSRVSW